MHPHLLAEKRIKRKCVCTVDLSWIEKKTDIRDCLLIVKKEEKNTFLLRSHMSFLIKE